MRGEKNVKPVNVDPRCIQEALRMYLQPIKNDDPELDFYTMYKRETTEYDTEYMQKYNEDLNTTLIFAGLFSAVSSAFVIDVQSKLQPDPAERSEAYLRAILLSLNRSVVPDEDPATPPSWNGPPTEIITTSDLMYASLLMSLLAAFVAMLGKQWLNRYLRHTGGSMVERCGDRQRKFDGLEKWPFRLFVEGLPVMLQIALLLLTCGLSRYMWSVNTSVARVIISFTVLGILFYIGIVAAGTSSYECPFQTPASIGLRHLRDSGMARRLLASLSPSNVVSLVYATRRNTWRLVARLSLPNVVSLMYATWMDARQGFVSASHTVYDAVRYPSSWDVSPSRIVCGIHSMSTKVGHQTIILLLQIDRTFGNAKHRLVQEIRRLRRAVLLPLITEDANHQPHVHRDGPGLRVRVWNLEALRKRNGDHARCACWVLQNITDPEAIDSDVRLAGTIRWFDGGSDHDLPYDSIVSTFEACFNSTKQPYPGMRDRAYYSARAILQINMRARAQSHECASRYPIPAVSSSPFKHIDPDLDHVIHMLERNSGDCGPILSFPRGDKNTHAHSLWMSNLFADLTHAGPSPTLESYGPYLNAAVTDHRPMIANILLMWDMFLGGHVEEETFWAIDKSDSLEAILSHLSITVMSGIADRSCLHNLNYLLEFLAAWENRPAYLTPMAYQWCSAISEAAGEPNASETTIEPSITQQHILRYQLRLPPQNSTRVWPPGAGLSDVGPGHDPGRLDASSHHSRRRPQHLTPPMYAHLLFITLEIGFRRDQSVQRLDHTSHHKWVLETAFSSDDDDVIADAVCVWIIGGGSKPPGSCARYLAKRVERGEPFSPRLRQASIRAIERIWCNDLGMSWLGLDTVHWLNRLDVDVDDIGDECNWFALFGDVIYSPMGLGSLSSHYWRLLDKLVAPELPIVLDSRDIEVMRTLEEAEDWEELGVWMVLIWTFLPGSEVLDEVLKSVGDIERATLKLLSRQPSVLPRFDDLSGRPGHEEYKDKLRQICDQARMGRLTSESPLQQLTHARPLVPLPFIGDDSF